MNARIIEENCIGCGVCESIAEPTIQIDGVAQIKEEVTESNIEIIKEAAEACPTGAIIVE